MRATYTGGLFAVGALLLDPFTATVEELALDVELVAPGGSGVDGAVAIASDLAHRGSARWRDAGRYLTVEPAEATA